MKREEEYFCVGRHGPHIKLLTDLYLTKKKKKKFQISILALIYKYKTQIENDHNSSDKLKKKTMIIKIMNIVCFAPFLSSGGSFGPCVRYKNFLDKEDVNFHCCQTL